MDDEYLIGGGFSMPETSKKYLTISEVVATGLMSRTTIWRQIKAGNLDSIKIGEATRIPVDALEEFIESHRTAKTRA